MEKKFIAGSFYFFKDMPGYSLHDLDYVIISDEIFKDYHHLYLIEDGIARDMFYWKKNTPEWHINQIINEKGFALDVAHLLIPSVAEYLGVTIEHLKQLTSIVDKIVEQVGPKYEYYKIIYESYIINNSFSLTDEQRMKAYKSYTSSRKQSLS